MKPLLMTLAIALGLGALGCFFYFARLARYNPSVRSMVASEQRQEKFLFGGIALIVAAALLWWWA